MNVMRKNGQHEGRKQGSDESCDEETEQEMGFKREVAHM
jgi:hypothetical protein